VVFSLVVVYFMDWVGGVDNGWLDGLLLDDGLDVLVDVVMDMLSTYDASVRGSVLGCANSLLVLELSSFGGEALLDVRVVSMVDFAMLCGAHLVSVLLRKNLTVFDWLDRGVVVVLVNFAVDNGL